MTTETWILFLGVGLTNLFALIGGLVNLSTRLTRIETDIKWIKAGCPKCQQNLEIHMK